MSDTQATEQNIAFTEMVFRFKKTELGDARPKLTLNVPVLSVAGAVEVLTSDRKKEIELLMQSIADTVRGAVGAHVAENKNLTADNFDASAFTWQAIANMEKQDRRSIPEEQWTSFIKEYSELMPGLTGKDEKIIEKHCEIFVKKCRNIASDKAALAKMEAALGMFVENSRKLEEFQDVVELLASRIDKYKNAEEVKIDAEAL